MSTFRNSNLPPWDKIFLEIIEGIGKSIFWNVNNQWAKVAPNPKYFIDDIDEYVANYIVQNSKMTELYSVSETELEISNQLVRAFSEIVFEESFLPDIEKWLDGIRPNFAPKGLINSDELYQVIVEGFSRHCPSNIYKSATNYVLTEFDNKFYTELLRNPSLLTTLNWRKFELLIGDLLESMGYQVELMRGTKDGGIDLIAFLAESSFGKQKHLIQAKQSKNKIEIEPVRNLIFNHQHFKATKSCLATTSRFTSGAWNLAKQYEWQIELKDFDGLFSWIETAAIKKGIIIK